MSFINVGKENSAGIDLYYEDHGAGNPVVLIHGWPLSSASWEKQVPPLLDAGYRVVSYDRRGFGYSSKPATGYNYNVLADDLNKVMTKLDLRYATLVGFSMGGGEVARYLGKYGPDRVSKAVFISAIPPFLLKTAENPEGVDGEIFNGIKKAVLADRPAFLTQFFSNFYNMDLLKGKKVSDEILQLSWSIGAMASPIGTLACIESWGEDFRKNLESINIPVLVLHGSADRIVPYASSGKRMRNFIADCHSEMIEGAPHGMNWTHAEEINEQLISFLKIPEGKTMKKDR
jgi:pimeloyl-ACP methyl ester carboxylesterase